MSHHLLKIKGGWQCQVCFWNWTSKPQTQCPGVRRYSWENKPYRLMTKTELGKYGLKLAPDQKCVGIVQSGTGKDWWQLYDKSEAILKQKKSPPSKSTRPLCPIGLDCLLVAAERGKPCPNKAYCGNLGAPLDLPYKTRVLKDGTHYLEVLFTHNYATTLELKAIGWAQSLHLPYSYFAGQAGSVLIVLFSERSADEAGWFEAERLNLDYLSWRAAAFGMPYAEWRDTSWWLEPTEEWRDAMLPDPLSNYFLPEYPHCILPLS